MTKEVKDQIISITTQAFRESFDEEFISRAQVKKSKARNAMFGLILNEKFIQSGKTMKSLSEAYGNDALDIVSLVIWSLNRGSYNKPKVAQLSGKTLRICDMA